MRGFPPSPDRLITFQNGSFRSRARQLRSIGDSTQVVIADVVARQR